LFLQYGAGGGFSAVTPWTEPYYSLRRQHQPLGNEKFAPLGGNGMGEFDCPIGIAVGGQHGLVLLVL
jgi:hypothetical protein